MKCKVYLHENAQIPQYIKKGDWIDLLVCENLISNAPNITKNGEVNFNTILISLGISMELPKGYEAHILPRSSTFKKTGLLLTNSMGIIDCSYAGMNDIWKANCLCTRNCPIRKDDVLFQFKIVLSQKATFWQKIKWLFTNKIKFEKVDALSSVNRGGFGSTDNE